MDDPLSKPVFDSDPRSRLRRSSHNGIEGKRVKFATLLATFQDSLAQKAWFGLVLHRRLRLISEL